jgi:hypothetical protein
MTMAGAPAENRNWWDALKEPNDFNPGAYPGILHHYVCFALCDLRFNSILHSIPGLIPSQSARLAAFEHAPLAANTPAYKPHAIIFIGGLSKRLLTDPYIPPLAAALAPTKWSIFSILLSSSYSGWGTHNLSDDSKEIAKCVNYIHLQKRKTRPNYSREVDGKIVLLGHSTGSQNALNYVYCVTHTLPPVDGVILQAPVSDRESMVMKLENPDFPADAEMYSFALQHAQILFNNHNQNEDAKPLMPSNIIRPFYGDVPVTAERFLSLQKKAFEHPFFVDDMFSSDVDSRQLAETFGAISNKMHLCVLYSGADEHVPERVDKVRLVGRWQNAVETSGEATWDAENSGLIDGANHSLRGEGQETQRGELVRRVVGFLKKVEAGVE